MHHLILQEQFLAHTQARLNASLNEYAVTYPADTVDKAAALGVDNSLFYRASGKEIGTILDQNQVFSFVHKQANNGSGVASNTNTEYKLMVQHQLHAS